MKIRILFLSIVAGVFAIGWCRHWHSENERRAAEMARPSPEYRLVHGEQTAWSAWRGGQTL